LELQKAYSISLGPPRLPAFEDPTLKGRRRPVTGGDLLLYSSAAKQLPIFGGGSAEYIAWRTIVEHFEQDLQSPSMKLASLRKMLRGEALELVAPVTSRFPDPLAKAFSMSEAVQ